MQFSLAKNNIPNCDRTGFVWGVVIDNDFKECLEFSDDEPTFDTYFGLRKNCSFCFK